MKRKIKTVSILFSLIFAIVAINLGGCTYSTGGNGNEFSGSDSCDVCEMRLLPEMVALDTGDSVVYEAIFRDNDGAIIDFPPFVEWESSTPNVQIDRYTGFAHVRMPLTSDAVITGRAHDCDGNVISARARIKKPGPKLW